jgi:subtilisin family serine protease
MDWSEIIISVVSVILTSLATWGVSRLTAWLNTKIKDKNALAYVSGIVEVVTTAVKATYQTYVETIKGSELWDTEAQKKALNKALEIAKEQLSENAKTYILNNYGDLDKYLIEKIESIIYDLKQK